MKKEELLKNSVPIKRIATARISLSNGKKIEVTNPEVEIIELFQYIENPKNKFLTLGGAKININQIVSTEWINEHALKGSL